MKSKYKVCPECESKIDHLEFRGNFTEIGYGTVFGDCTFDGTVIEETDHETNHYDDYTSDGPEIYYCPVCNEELDLEDLLDGNAEEEKAVVKVVDGEFKMPVKKKAKKKAAKKKR